MGTYKFEGNDPTKQREYKSPEEVKAMLLGGVPGDEQYETDDALPWGRYLQEAIDEDNTHIEAMDEATRVWELAPAFNPEELDRAEKQGVGRCQTCGRKFDCCCQGCMICSQRLMEDGKTSSEWANRMVKLGDIDPREDMVR